MKIGNLPYHWKSLFWKWNKLKLELNLTKLSVSTRQRCEAYPLQPEVKLLEVGWRLLCCMYLLLWVSAISISLFILPFPTINKTFNHHFLTTSWITRNHITNQLILLLSKKTNSKISEFLKTKSKNISWEWGSAMLRCVTWMNLSDAVELIRIYFKLLLNVPSCWEDWKIESKFCQYSEIFIYVKLFFH